MKRVALTTKQKAFVAAYDGNATEAARAAGYSGSDATLATAGYRLMRHAEVRAAINAREEGALAPLVLTREERQELWSRMAMDEKLDASVRLRASELLGKSQADFTERVEIKGELTLLELIRESMGKNREG